MPKLRPQDHRPGHPAIYLQVLYSQCCQLKNQTRKSQNQTFIRPYFHQKSDQKRTRNRRFGIKIRPFQFLRFFFILLFFYRHKLTKLEAYFPKVWYLYQGLLKQTYLAGLSWWHCFLSNCIKFSTHPKHKVVTSFYACMTDPNVSSTWPNIDLNEPISWVSPYNPLGFLTNWIQGYICL